MTTLFIILGIIFGLGLLVTALMCINAPIINESENSIAEIHETETGYRCEASGSVVLSNVDYNGAMYFAEYYNNRGFLVHWSVKKHAHVQ